MYQISDNDIQLYFANSTNFWSLEVVDRVSEAQLTLGDNFYFILLSSKG